ncbi:Cell wall-associated polypeptide CWBP200 [Bacteroidales bacterium Barb6XT]|nr:Cell wall-associated polypeptide CWBP200 [Bacteroidales bacterium Barb6XT]
MTYDPNGNILAKSDISGAYRYETPGKPYAVSHIEQASPVNDLDLIYSSTKRPLEIKGRDRRIAFRYNPGNDRVRMSTYALAADSAENLLSVRTYLGSYECDSSAAGVTERLYLGGDPYHAPLILLKREGREDVYAVSRDFLGSIIAIADSSGQAVERRTYDPWGRMTREAADSALCITDRGYTSHEHIKEIGLINMNARLYDPLIGRFFSPDPKMMDGETQALNRYSYAMNNPFAYTDPSGEFVFALIPVLVAVYTVAAAVVTAATLGAVAGAVMTGVTLAKSGASAGEMAWKIPAAMVIGGAAGAAGGLLGAGMPAFGAAAAALSGVASVAAASLIGSTTSFLTGANTLSVGLLYYNFNKKGLENPFGSVQQSIFSALDIAGMVLPAVGGVASALTKAARGALPSASTKIKPAVSTANQLKKANTLHDERLLVESRSRPLSPAEKQRVWAKAKAIKAAQLDNDVKAPGPGGMMNELPRKRQQILTRQQALNLTKYDLWEFADLRAKELAENYAYSLQLPEEMYDNIVALHFNKAKESALALYQQVPICEARRVLFEVKTLTELENVVDRLIDLPHIRSLHADWEYLGWYIYRDYF